MDVAGRLRFSSVNPAVSRNADGRGGSSCTPRRGGIQSLQRRSRNKRDHSSSHPALPFSVSSHSVTHRSSPPPDPGNNTKADERRCTRSGDVSKCAVVAHVLWLFAGTDEVNNQPCVIAKFSRVG